MADDAMTAPAASTPATSAPSTPATPAVGTDFMSSIDSMLTSGETPDTTDQPDTGDEPIPEDPAQPQHAAATEHPPESWDSEIGEPQIVDGPSGEKLHQYTPEQSLALHSNSRFAQELRAAIPDITVQDAISHDQAYTDLSKIVHDMRRGAPDGVQRFANMILKESGGSRFAAGLTEQLVNHVRQNDPMAYDGLKGGFEKDIEKELYSLALKAKNDPRPAVRDGYRQLAEWFHYHIANGEVKPIDEYATFDPLADRAAQLDARERELQAQDQERHRNRVNSWTASVRTDIEAGLSAEIQTGLKPYAARFEKSPGLLKMITESVTRQVRDQIKANAEFRDRFGIHWDQGQQELSRQSAQSVKDFYLARARSILKQQLPKMISSASNGMIESNKSRHQQLERASSASHRVSGATGAPPKQSIMQPPGKFKTPADYAAELDRVTA